MYKKLNIKTISKFSITNFNKNFNLNVEKKNDLNIKGNLNLNFSNYFWNLIFSRDFLHDFLYNSYLESKKDFLGKEDYLKLKREIDFILNKINITKTKINFVNKNKIPGGDDIFFSYRLFSSILYFINDYFGKEKISLGTREGIIFDKKINSLDDLLKNIEFYKTTNFIKLLVEPLIKKYINLDEKIIYKFDIFWPSELILIGILGDLIREKNKESIIVVDLSSGNEQFDFSQRIDLINNADKDFFKYFDFFIIDNDFGNSIEELNKYLNGKIKKEELENIIFYDDKVNFNKNNTLGITKNIFNEFIKSTFNGKDFSEILGYRSLYARFLPYKCYWSKCNFCAINSQNKFSYSSEYSYDFFINKWIEYIKKYDIKSINFKDEAIPPKVIIQFAKKLIENNLVVNYQFRTRFEKDYTLENCKIIAKSGCGYCGIGLESAVERVNETIANKGNKGITLKDKTKIIHNFDKAGVSIHNYSILGFPGETDKETVFTYKFLKENIIKSNFFTCTPNIFGLMKGPKIFSEREKYGIVIDQKDLKNPFNLVFEFNYKGKERNLKLLKKLEEDLHKTQFLPWLDINSHIKGRLFWDYIDRSYIFYLLKRYHEKNPFYTYMNCNKEVLSLSIEEILNKKYKISNYYQLFEYNNDTKIYIYDWVGCKDTIINIKYKDFIIKYDNNLNLLENLNVYNLHNDENIENLIFLLLNDRILIKN